MTKLMIDTCGWIDFLRSTEGIMGNVVAQAIENDCAVLCDVIVAELLQGAKGEKEKQQLQFLFETVQRVDVLPTDWDSAGLLLQLLRGKGVILPLTDALIAVVAQRNQLSVLTADKHFNHLPVNCI